jgi:hypothetical protein
MTGICAADAFCHQTSRLCVAMKRTGEACEKAIDRCLEGTCSRGKCSHGWTATATFCAGRPPGEEEF